MIEPTYHECWTGPTYLRRLRHLARSVRHLQGLAVEIGVWEGRSLMVIAEAIGSGTVIGVDHWKGSAYDGTDGPASERDVYATAQANVAPYDNIVLARGDWREVMGAEPLASEPLRFVHLDGSHAYAEVEAQVRMVMERLVPGGVVCGDDWTHAEVEAAVTVALDGRDDGLLAAVGPMWWWQATP